MTSATQHVPIDVSSLADGQLTYDIWLVDAAGNIGSPPLEFTPTLDTQAPAGYTVTPDNQPYVNNANAASAGFTISGGQSGDTYTYTLTLNGADITPANNTGTLDATGSVDIPLDASSLDDGTLTYTQRSPGRSRHRPHRRRRRAPRSR